MLGLGAPGTFEVTGDDSSGGFAGSLTVPSASRTAAAVAEVR
jgi:hypothetical protein